MPLRAQIIQEALAWQGTPYHHYAALKGVGCDCVGLLVGIARAVGCLSLDYRPPPYSQEWHFHHTEELLLRVLTELGCTPRSLDARQPGDILTLQFGKVSSHTAVLVANDPPYIVHAARDMHRVVHHRLAGDLLTRVRQCYTFPGVS